MFGSIKTVYAMETEGNKYFYINEYDLNAAVNYLSLHSISKRNAAIFYEIDLETMTETEHKTYSEKHADDMKKYYEKRA